MQTDSLSKNVASTLSFDHKVTEEQPGVSTGSGIEMFPLSTLQVKSKASSLAILEAQKESGAANIEGQTEHLLVSEYQNDHPDNKKKEPTEMET